MENREWGGVFDFTGRVLFRLHANVAALNYLGRVFAMSKEEGITTDAAARRIAEERLVG